MDRWSPLSSLRWVACEKPQIFVLLVYAVRSLLLGGEGLEGYTVLAIVPFFVYSRFLFLFVMCLPSPVFSHNSPQPESADDGSDGGWAGGEVAGPRVGGEGHSRSSK